MGRALGVPARAEALARQVEQDLRAAAEKAASASSASRRVVALYAHGEAVQLVFGRGSGIDTLVEAAGGLNVGSELGIDDTGPVTAEAILAARPDVVLVTTTGLESVGGLDGLLAIGGLARTPAGEHRKVLAYEEPVPLRLRTPDGPAADRTRRCTQPHHQHHLRSSVMSKPILIVVVAMAFLAAACGNDDATSASGVNDDGCHATTAAPTTAAPTTAAPRTAAATTTSAATKPTIVAGADPAVDAVVTAYSSVFDSSVPFATKSQYLLEAEALQPTVDAYGTTGQRFGGIKLVPTAVTITGDTATVTYDVMFGTTTQYQGLTGAAVQQDGAWKVTRDEFCAFMTSARTPCPTP